ncbi:MAG: hypothetical protein ABI811_09285 [Acidobacteriota bacterium]
MTPNEIVAMVKDGVTTACVLVGASVAYLGLQTWKRQLHGNTQFDLARRILKSAYSIREAMALVRSPVLSVGEQESALPVEASREHQRAIRLAACNVRWRVVVDARTEFNTVLLEAEVVFGKDVRSACEGLLQCTKELFFAMEDMLGEGPDLGVEERRKARDIGFESSAKPEFTKKIEASITVIESLVRPHLQF